jgi:hypothetical protein
MINSRDIFNPNASIEVVPLFDGHHCIVVDNFLRQPQALVDFANSKRAHFRYDTDNYFPGLEMDMGREFALSLEQYFMLQMRRHFAARRQLGVACRLSMTTLQTHELKALQRLCHRDADIFPPGVGIAAAVVYLFQNPDLGGTSFYRPKLNADATRELLSTAQNATSEACTALLKTAPAYLHASNDYFELIHTVPAKWNRAIFYQGTIFHAAHIIQPGLLNSEPNTARLALNGFFKFKKTA